MKYSKIIGHNDNAEKHKQVQIHWKNDRWHRSNNNKITVQKQTNKQTNKQTYKRCNLCNKKTYTCIFLSQGNEKNLMKLAAMSVKPLKTVKRLLKILFNIDIMDLCPCFCIVSKRQLESVTKVLT